MPPKRYGESKVTHCPFCQKQVTTKNCQGVPTCLAHAKSDLLNLKCVCDSWLDLATGKYGPFFVCMDCGPVSFAKALEINEGNNIFFHPKDAPKPKRVSKKKGSVRRTFRKKRGRRKTGRKRRFTSSKAKFEKDGKVVTIRSDELDFL